MQAPKPLTKLLTAQERAENAQREKETIKKNKLLEQERERKFQEKLKNYNLIEIENIKKRIEKLEEEKAVAIATENYDEIKYIDLEIEEEKKNLAKLDPSYMMPRKEKIKEELKEEIKKEIIEEIKQEMKEEEGLKVKLLNPEFQVEPGTELDEEEKEILRDIEDYKVDAKGYEDRYNTLSERAKENYEEILEQIKSLEKELTEYREKKKQKQLKLQKERETETEKEKEKDKLRKEMKKIDVSKFTNAKLWGEFQDKFITVMDEDTWKEHSKFFLLGDYYNLYPFYQRQKTLLERGIKTAEQLEYDKKFYTDEQKEDIDRILKEYHNKKEKQIIVKKGLTDEQKKELNKMIEELNKIKIKDIKAESVEEIVERLKEKHRKMRESVKKIVKEEKKQKIEMPVMHIKQDLGLFNKVYKHIEEAENHLSECKKLIHHLQKEDKQVLKKKHKKKSSSKKVKKNKVYEETLKLPKHLQEVKGEEEEEEEEKEEKKENEKLDIKGLTTKKIKDMKNKELMPYIKYFNIPLREKVVGGMAKKNGDILKLELINIIEKKNKK